MLGLLLAGFCIGLAPLDVMSGVGPGPRLYMGLLSCCGTHLPFYHIPPPTNRFHPLQYLEAVNTGGSFLRSSSPLPPTLVNRNATENQPDQPKVRGSCFVTLLVLGHQEKRTWRVMTDSNSLTCPAGVSIACLWRRQADQQRDPSKANQGMLAQIALRHTSNKNTLQQQICSAFVCYE